jgi:hypothetical protein
MVSRLPKVPMALLEEEPPSEDEDEVLPTQSPDRSVSEESPARL